MSPIICFIIGWAALSILTVAGLCLLFCRIGQRDEKEDGHE